MGPEFIQHLLRLPIVPLKREDSLLKRTQVGVPLRYIGLTWHPPYAQLFNTNVERIIAGEAIYSPEKLLPNIIKNILGLKIGTKGLIDFTYESYGHNHKSIYIANTIVLEEFRRHGIGTAIVKGLETIAQTRGVGFIWGHLRPQDKEWVYPFWRSLGYKFTEGGFSSGDKISKNL